MSTKASERARVKREKETNVRLDAIAARIVGLRGEHIRITKVINGRYRRQWFLSAVRELIDSRRKYLLQIRALAKEARKIITNKAQRRWLKCILIRPFPLYFCSAERAIEEYGEEENESDVSSTGE